MDIDVSQLNRLAAELGKVSYRVLPMARQAVEKATLDTERDAKAIAPVDTGNLRNSIGHVVYGLTGEVGPTAAYGAYVEEGTSTQAPQSYMGPAFDRNVPAFVKACEVIAVKAAQP